MLLSKLIKLFPVPKILKIDWVGVDVSDESIMLVEIKQNGNRRVLGNYAEKVIPEGVLASGQILDKVKMKEVLVELRRISHTPYVNVSLPEEKSFLFTAEVSGHDHTSLRQSIEFILEENIPIPPSETLFQFDLIEWRGKNQDRALVSVTAIHRKIAEDYCDIFVESGFIPYSTEVEGRPLVRAVIPRGDKKNRIVVNYNERNAGLFLVSDAVIRYTSTIKLSPKDIPENFKISEIADPLEYLQKEISMVESYWYSKEPNKKIDSIIICGRKADDNLMLDKLRKNLGVPVEMANVWVNVCNTAHYVPDIDKDESFKYATAIGLAIKGK